MFGSEAVITCLMTNVCRALDSKTQSSECATANLHMLHFNFTFQSTVFIASSNICLWRKVLDAGLLKPLRLKKLLEVVIYVELYLKLIMDKERVTPSFTCIFEQ